MSDRRGRTCENCIFYEDHWSECRYDPPVFHVNFQSGKWPAVHPQDWCRMFTPMVTILPARDGEE